MEYFTYFIVGIALLFLLVRFLAWPLKILLKLIANGVLGIILLLIANFIGKYLGFSVGINPWTALIAGFFGVPGVIFLIIFKVLL
ncbi:pro-sigmaK processing inhibitor BofA family protein [Clostridium aestuarii]|uniref:Pro-sigmaK processing inhibitor BofA family protein n=1 Tax=Clostridium aestuarii TaxID=338193 RepID=A0ABT4D3Q6_9CLOT|nr:pro-sigmaK processing inhibitor BofA family protein [Clostridium aestuarii]MCY6485864.1 pro-sigmaK processing inhibitor BofA family protein [Clostridium aestuarii]